MDFVLVTDTASANYIRSALAKRGVSNIVVGNFTALIDALKELWLIAEPEGDFSEHFRATVLEMRESFWAESILIDEVEVLRQIENTLLAVMDEISLELLSSDNIVIPQLGLDESAISPRQLRYFGDIIRLLNTLTLKPVEYEVARQWSLLDFGDSLQPLQVWVAGELKLSGWRRQLVDKLCATSQPKHHQILSDIVAAMGISDTYNQTPHDQSKTSQRHLLAAAESTTCSYQILAQRMFADAPPQTAPQGFNALLCRDWLEECQVVASRIQVLIEQGNSPQDIAFIYPAEIGRLDYLVLAMDRQGIVVSNLPTHQTAYDWQTALLRDLFSLQVNPSVPMIRDSLKANPLISHAIKSDPDSVFTCCLNEFDSIEAILESLYALTNELQSIHRFTLTSDRWMSLLSQIKSILARQLEDDFFTQCQAVLVHLQSSSFTLNHEKVFYLDAVTAVSSLEHVPHAIKHLFVLGFNEGCYRYATKDLVASTVLDLQTWQHLGYSDALEHKLNIRRQCFIDSLAKANETLTILASRQSFDGSALSLSESALDLALCFQTIDKLDPSALFTPLSEVEDGFLPYHSISVTSAEKLQVEQPPSDLSFGCNLLSIHTDENGEQRAESPSSLEKMMVSPLDWLLTRQGLEDKAWEIQDLDIMTQGTVAHKVFELYKEHQYEGYSEELFEVLYTKALEEDAPFVLLPTWRLERFSLQKQIKSAFIAFVEWLDAHHWCIEEVELRLKGKLWNMSVKGFADAILINSQGTKDEQVLILDYKKSSSDKRVKRLDEGLDLQTYIYRQLYGQARANSGKELPPAGVIKSGYYTLNDKVLVLDHADTSTNAIKIITPTVNLQQQSIDAIARISERVEELSNGEVKLNRSTDAGEWSKRGVAVYALEGNPVIKRFVIADVMEDKA